MKCLLLLGLLKISILVFLSTNLFAISIEGPILVCKGECYTYQVNGGLGNYYEWTSSSGSIVVIDENTVEICFEEVGTSIVKVRDLFASQANQFTEIEVKINSINTPDIIFSKNETCKAKYFNVLIEDFEEKLRICYGSHILFSALNVENQTLEWQVNGGKITDTISDSIWVKWDKPGAGNIKLIAKNEAGCIDSIKYDFEILPEIVVDILGANGSAYHEETCIGQEVYLEAIAENAFDFIWDIEGVGFLTGNKVKFSFDNAGEFNVKLVAYKDFSTELLFEHYQSDELDSLNENANCTCSDTAYYSIKVNSGIFPLIDCTGTICSGSEATYFAEDLCETYNWSVSPNGSVTKGGGSKDQFISVVWNQGGEGEVTLETPDCQQNACSEINKVRIPIIGKNVAISGRQIVCNEDISTYSVPQFQGISYNWSINKLGTIIDGQGTNKIKVKWQTNVSDIEKISIIKVKFENCYLGCSDSTSIVVSVLDLLYILGDSNSFCLYGSGYFTFNNHYNTLLSNPKWTITSPGGLIQIVSNFELHTIFTETGIYRIKLEIDKGLRCNDTDEIFVEVFPNPETPKKFIGPGTICKNQYSTYSVSGLKPNENIQWTIYDGNGYGSQSYYTGESITYKWKSNGPFKIEAFIFNIITYCNSSIAEFVITNHPEISGSTIVCLDQIEKYNIGNLVEANLIWSILPGNAGTIISTENGILEVLWHKPGMHKVRANYCSGTYELQVEVLPKIVINLAYPSHICHGELADVLISASANSKINIIDRNNTVISDISNPKLSAGSYIAEIIDANGCVTNENIKIEEFPQPVVKISTPDLTSFCHFLSFVKIVAEDREDNLSYKWYRNNIVLPEISAILKTFDFGIYHVVATDKNGCTTKSNYIKLFDYCEGNGGGEGPGGGGGTCEGGDITIIGNIVDLKCNEKSFEFDTTGLNSKNFKWDFDDPDSGEENHSTHLKPKHIFSHAGYFHVEVNGNSSDFGFKAFEIPVVPKFDFNISCFGDPVEFINLSTHIPGYDNLSYIWDFGDPLSGLMNNSIDINPVHIFSGEGTFIVTLSVQDINGCISSAVKNVLIKKDVDAEILTFPHVCEDMATPFSVKTIANIVKYNWDFGDAASGNANYSGIESPYHFYKNTGNFSVYLNAIDIDKCHHKAFKTIDIFNNPINGDIKITGTIPKCKGEEITLTAPAGGDHYYWSDGSTGQTISVIDPDIYSVTISSDNNCDYIPEPVQIFDIKNLDVIIFGETFEDPYIPTIHYDSLSVCQGTDINLFTSYLSNAKYLWSNGNTKDYIDGLYFRSLPPGRYQFDVQVIDLSTGCKILSKPYNVIINPNPASPVIDSDDEKLCENELHILKVTNHDPTLKYFWQNGVSNTEIIASLAGNYQVTAITKSGCISQSNILSIIKKTDINTWNTGCKEVCFPEEICLNIQNYNYKYELLKDGVIIQSINSPYSELKIIETGDYQLKVTNPEGCFDISDFLSFSALPSDQSVSGTAFIDKNNNGLYDIGEIPLKAIKVMLIQGNNIINSCMTDDYGNYIFDPVTDSHLKVLIDTSGLGYELKGNIDSLLIFSQCVEDKKIDFPFIQNCNIAPETFYYFVCPGQSVIFNTKEYYAGMKDTISLKSVNNCDSLIMIEVFSYPEIEVSIEAFPTCSNDKNGSIYIDKISGDNLKFAIDSLNFYYDSIEFTGLSIGYHTLNITDKNNCTESLDFEIETFPEPNIDIMTFASCENLKYGSIDINTEDKGLQYSLNGINFNEENEFNDLLAEDYILYILTNDKCLYEIPFTIDQIPEPQVQLKIKPSCEGENNGSLKIEEIGGTMSTYSLDNEHFSTETLLTGMIPGNYELFVKASEFCTYSYPFAIKETPLPQVEIETSNTCSNASEGVIIIKSKDAGLLYSIDNFTFTLNNTFTNLSAGKYQIKVKDSLNCTSSSIAEIHNNPDLIVNFPQVSTDCKTQDILLSPNVNSYFGAISYRWNDGSEEKEKIINKSGNYIITVSDDCSEISNFWDIVIEKPANENSIIIPNIFSPDGDGYNDCMMVDVNKQFKILEYSIMVFDRWGEKIYVSEDFNQCWNGYFKDKLVSSGVYVYVINYVVDQCDEPKKFSIFGDVTVIY